MVATLRRPAAHPEVSRRGHHENEEACQVALRRPTDGAAGNENLQPVALLFEHRSLDQ
jgi:hypothetical protein